RRRPGPHPGLQPGRDAGRRVQAFGPRAPQEPREGVAMVNFRNLKRIGDKAKEQVDKRGGTDSLKEDAEELKGIAKGEGSLKDKAKAAGKAIKEPGAGEKQPE